MSEDIIFLTVATGSTPIVDHCQERARAYGKDTIPRVLTIIPKRQGKMTYAFDKYRFHYIVSEQGIVFLCMADGDASQRICFACLENVKSAFNARYGGDFGGGDVTEFRSELKHQMDYFNDPRNDKVRHIRAQIDETKQIMVENIERLLDRGDHIDSLVQKTDNLRDEASTFKKSAVTLKRQMWWKKVWMWAIIIFIVLAAGVAVSMVLCGGVKYEKCQ
eukprot:PhM_4_TR2214/c0_g1_i1/m.33125/K08515/VAMP7; vesicle-associated membrane protein 7